MSTFTATITKIITQLGSVIIPIDKVAKKFGKTGTQVTRQCGVTQLHRFAPDEVFEHIAGNLIKQLVEGKNIRGIFGSSNLTSADIIPSFTTSAAYHAGLKNAACHQIGLGCVGGMQALEFAYTRALADWSVEQVASSYIVVVGDQTSRVLDPENYATAVLFSEGCAAILVETDLQAKGWRIENIRTVSRLSVDLYALRQPNPFSSQQKALLAPGYAHMDGDSVYAFGTKIVFPEVMRLLGQCKLGINQYFIPHQANKRMLDTMGVLFDIPANQIYTRGITTIGNTVGASVFFGLDDVIHHPVAFPEIILGAFGAEDQIGAARLVQTV